MYTAFPCSDYYGGSAPYIIHHQSPWLARFLDGRTMRVPVFQLSTCVPVGGMLYPWRLGTMR